MRKTGHIKYLERKNECLILSRALVISNMVALTGLEGSGKTTIVREHLKKNESNVKWYTLSNFLTLSSLLGFADLTADEALGKALTAIFDSDVEYIVWDNLHFLNFQVQQKLIHTLINAGREQKHIFISDEKIELPSDIPLLSLGGLTQDEVIPFLELFGVEISAEKVDDIVLQTGALPLLLKQWAINPNINAFEKNLNKILSAGQMLLLKTLAFSKISLNESDINKFEIQDAVDHLAELQKKNLVEVTTDAEIQVPAFIRKIVITTIKKEEQISLSKSLYRVLSLKNQVDDVAKFIVALQANENQEALDHCKKFELEDVEQLTSENTHLLIESLLNSKQINFSENEYSKPARLLIHALILANKRSDAIERAYQLLDKIHWQNNFNSEKQWLAYDLIYWLNRSKYSSEIQKYISQFINHSKAPLTFLFQIELNFVLAQSAGGAKGARINLLRIITEIKRVSAESSTSDLAAANAYYQLGINFMMTNENDAAILHFTEAKKLFQKVKRTYFELFCEFNICMILFQHDETQDLILKLSELKKRAALNGYTYLLAGADLLSAIIAFNNLESSKALGFIEDSVSKIDNGMPINSKFDILSTKIRILKDLGLEDSAQKIFGELRRISSDLQKNLLGRLAIECQIDFIPLAEVEDAWRSIDPNTDKTESLVIYLLERGIKEKSTNLRPNLRNQLAIQQCELISAIRDANIPLAEDALRQLENLLKRTPEDRIERIAMWCLSASLNKDKRDYLLEKIELYIRKTAMTDSARNFLTAWSKALKKNIPIKELPEYLSVHPQDLERWRLWLPPEKKKKFTLHTQTSVTDTDELLTQIPKDGIYIVDNQKDVYLKGKKISDFEKKSILIQILVLIISNNPEKLTKASLASALWGETYDPAIHDARIYTSIQRIRSILGGNSIENWEGGYRWSQKLPFYLYRSNESQGLKQNKIANVLVESLRKRKQNNSNESLQWMSRADLVEAGNTSDATAKRVLAELLKDNVIEKKGNGPSTVYRLVR